MLRSCLSESRKKLFWRNIGCMYCSEYSLSFHSVILLSILNQLPLTLHQHLKSQKSTLSIRVQMIFFFLFAVWRSAVFVFRISLTTIGPLINTVQYFLVFFLCSLIPNEGSSRNITMVSGYCTEILFLLFPTC